MVVIRGKKAKGLFCCIAILVCSKFGWAQCPTWLENPSPGPTGGQPVVSIVWDPDGPGPLVERLVIAGNSTVGIGTAYPSRITMWDGSRWTAMSPNLDTVVRGLTVWNGELYAAGRFLVGTVMRECVTRWDGEQWADPISVPTTGGTVSVLGTMGDSLIAGGTFTSIGGVAANRIAAFDGTQWQPLASGVNGEVLALTEFEGALVAAGRFTTAGGQSARRIARWNGVAWSPLGSGFDDLTVFALTVHQGELFAGGSFTTSGGVAVDRVAQWDGAVWSRVGAGFTQTVFALRTYRGELHAGGALEQTTLPKGLARWDGATWRDTGPVSGFFQTIAEYDGKLWCGGSCTGVGDVGGTNLLIWDGTRWSGLGGGVDAQVRKMVVHDGAVVAVGDFSVAGDTVGRRVASWDGRRWEGLAGSIDGEVTSVASYGGNIVIGGSFLNINGVAASRVAIWDGANWRPLGSGVDGGVTLLHEYAGDLYVGGSFALAGGNPAQNLARWNGSTWAAVPAVGGQASAQFLHAAVFQGRLYLAGNFELTLPGQSPPRATRIVAWDGASFTPLTFGVSGGISGLEVEGSRLVVTGGFESAGSLPIARSAAWDGSAWSAFGPATNLSFGALGRMHGQLAAALTSTTSQVTPTSALARWDGSAWVPDPPEFVTVTGGSSEVLCMLDFHDEAMLGGAFGSIGGRRSGFFGRESHSGVPRIIREPAQTLLACASASDVEVGLSPGYPSLEIQWSLAEVIGGPWQDLTDGPLIVGGVAVGTVSGTGDPSLRMQVDRGNFMVQIRCRVTTGCGSVTSEEVEVRAACLGPCDPDVNQDGNVDQDDVAYLITVVAGGENPTGVDPDFNGDGSADQDDVVALITSVAGGPCP